MFERGELNCEGIQTEAKQAERRTGFPSGEASRCTGVLEGEQSPEYMGQGTVGDGRER